MKFAAKAKTLAVELALEDAAQADAVAGLPGQDAQAMTAAETKAIDAAHEEVKKEVQGVNDCRLAAHKALDECQSTLDKAGEARRGIEAETPPTRKNLSRLEEERDRASAAYTAFKSKHRLTREASRDDRITQVTWAIVVAVIESMVNSYFYLPISDLGLLGGFFTAGFVSVVNVAFAFLGGALGLRFLGHIEPSKKLGGVVALIACLSICVLVIALSALLRGHVDALGAAGGLDTGTLFDSAWEASLASFAAQDVWALFSSLNSFLLTFVGALCAVVGFWKGWAYDDPYPGFGNAYRHKEQTQQDYDDAQEEVEDAQREWRDEHRRKLHSEAGRLTEAANSMQAARIGFDKSIGDARGIGGEAALLAKELLSVYRQENLKIRAAPAPRYFDEFPPSSDFASFDADIEIAAQALAEVQAQVQRMAESCNGEQKAIQRALDLTPDVSP